MEIGLPKDFKDFLRLLAAEGVEYLLIGGYAVAYHGYPRATEDMDIWVAARSDNAHRIVKVLREFGFDVPELTEDLFLRADSIVRMGVPPLRLELSTTIAGVEFDECYNSRVTDTIDGIPVSLINLPDLKKNKKATGRFRDLDDLERLP